MPTSVSHNSITLDKPLEALELPRHPLSIFNNAFRHVPLDFRWRKGAVTHWAFWFAHCGGCECGCETLLPVSSVQAVPAFFGWCCFSVFLSSVSPVSHVYINPAIAPFSLLFVSWLLMLWHVPVRSGVPQSDFTVSSFEAWTAFRGLVSSQTIGLCLKFDNDCHCLVRHTSRSARVQVPHKICPTVDLAITHHSLQTVSIQ